MAREPNSRRWHGLLLALCASAGVDAGNAQARLAGRPVAAVIADLQDASLQFLFSSDLVSDSMQVTVEPRTRDRLAIAREVLAPHGLTLRAVTPSLYIVIRAGSQMPAQTLSGRVLDAQSGAALSGARVELLPVGRVAWSDTHGRFAFDGLVSGQDYRLRATIDDYARGETPVRLLRDGGAVDGTVRLERVALDTVVVEASRYSLAADNGDAQRLGGAELRDQPEIADDPIRALRRVPGVVQGGISAASNLRGGEIADLLLLLDGFSLRQPYHMPSYQRPFSLLDEDLVGAIDVYTGGFPARYGNRLGGVFDVSTTETAAAPRTSLGLSFFNAHARTAGISQSEDWSWRAAARVGTLRSLLDSFSVDAGRPSYSDVLLSGTYRLPGGGTLSGNMLWAADEYRLDDDDEQAELASPTRYEWLRADFAPTESTDASLWLGHSRLASDRTGSLDKPDFHSGNVEDHRKVEYWDLRGVLNWQWSERSRLNAGFEWTRGEADYRYDGSAHFAEPVAELFSREPDLERHLQLAPTQTRIAAFISQRVRLWDRVIPEIGIRVQQFRATGGIDELTWDPRFGVRWEVQPRTSLRLHWGRFHQADELHELAVADGVTDFVQAQRSDHLILGLEHRFTNGLQLRAEAFRKRQDFPRARFENLLTAMEVLPEIAPDRVRVAPHRSEMRGLELSLGYETDAWRGWTSLTLAEALDDFDGVDVPRSWDQKSAWMTGIDWRRGQWRIGATAAYHTGWPTTPVIYNEEGDALLGARNSGRLGDFATLNLNVEYRRPLAMGSLAVALEISNLTNRRNQCCVDLDVETEDEEAEIITEKEYWPQLLPSLSVQWEF